jgi:hypothetical protein
MLDLADAFTGPAEAFADFIEGVGLAILEAETHLQDGDFAFVELFIHDLTEELNGVGAFEHFLRVGGGSIGNEVADAAAFAVDDFGVERGGRSVDVHDGGPHGAWGHLHLRGDFMVVGDAAGFAFDRGGDFADLAVARQRLDRHSDDAALIGDAAADRLFDPPSGVGAEFGRRGI